MNHRQKVPKALTTPQTIAGGHRKAVIFNGILAAVTIFASFSLLYVPLFMMTHGMIIYATKKDPQWLEVLIRYMRNKKIYRS